MFSQARDVDEGHARLNKRALNHLIAQRSTKYHVCTICGYVADDKKPENYPICGTPESKFEKVDYECALSARLDHTLILLPAYHT
ncbi:hypothetical protein KAU88_02235 [Candidatus Bathyarchaeota archaeon]|nr:hypothetical protein [Candidatus Bathyarchaeota archaeon]